MRLLACCILVPGLAGLLLITQTAAAPAPADAAPAVALAPAARPATPAELDVLTGALMKVAREMERWAYTETTLIKDEKGNVKQDRVVRHDPSKPYAEQELPLKINGQAPTARQLQEYRRRGERRAARAEQPDGFGPLPSPSERARPSQSVGDLVDLGHALVLAEDAERVTYELPLRKLGNTRFPPENFQVRVRILKAGGLLERAEARLREPFRTKLVVKINSGEASADFAAVDPRYPPALIAARGAASASFLFFHLGGNGETQRADLRHVTPYRERFEVQIGPLRALDF